MAFSNLHAHSEGSLLDGTGTPIQRAKEAKNLGQNSMGLSDHGNLIMAPGHIKACNKVGIKPIVGMEAYFKPDRFKQDKDHKKAFHLLLIAKNEAGFKNLIKLSSEAYKTGFYNKPCLDFELLKDNNEGLICSSACISGYLPQLIQQGEDRKVADCIEQHLSIFGEDNYKLEIMPHDIPVQKLINIALFNLSLEYNIPLLATADSHYPYKDWKDTQDVLLMISTGQSLSSRKKKREQGEDVYEMNVPLHMFSEAEMFEQFHQFHPNLTQKTVTDAINESQKIADSVEPFDIDRSDKLPKVKTGTNETPYELLEKWCREGMKRIDKVDDEEYEARLAHELKTLKDMGVVPYFVLVGKMMRFVREQKIRVSSGRGSAAGSLVCYLIGITSIDPIGHELLFERFLNPNRKGLPDIDIDFQPDKIPIVKEWLKKECGEDRICDISAFGTYNPKGALKDVARVLDVPFNEVNIVTKVIPDATDVGGAANVPPLTTLRTQYETIDKFAKKYPDVWKHALRLEGQTKQLSKHPAGVIVADRPIEKLIPVLKGKESLVTAWSARADNDVISEMNILKIDILSLDGLNTQGNTIEIIEEQLGEKIDLDELPVAKDPTATDPEVLKLFAEGKTLGIFQFGGSRGITSFLRHTKPDRFEDLVAVNALYRPGPLEGGDAFKYGDLKNGKLPVTYWHESVKPILEKTYGVMVYQEQMQQIAQVLGQFSPSDSDDMRKATSKIYRMGKAEARDFLADYKDRWDQGCLANGLEQSEADLIWERMLSFGSYSFNRSHASSYSLSAYQDAHLKYHYPQPFYASLLTQHPDRVQDIIREGKQLGVNILPPDINNSTERFAVTDEGLLYGLRAVKYVGEESAEEILSKRPFKNYADFEERVTKKKCNKRVKEYLLNAGAFDSLGARQEWSTQEKREAETLAMGVAISGAPDISKYEFILDPRINTEDDIEKIPAGKGATIGGEIASVSEHKIKSGQNKGKLMAFVDVVYKDNEWSLTVFKKYYDKYKDVLKQGNLIIARGRTDDKGSILVDSIAELDKLKEAMEKKETEQYV